MTPQILLDRAALYQQLKASFDKLEAMTPEEIVADHQNNLDLLKVKLDQQKERLEALGVPIGS